MLVSFKLKDSIDDLQQELVTLHVNAMDQLHFPSHCIQSFACIMVIFELVLPLDILL